MDDRTTGALTTGQQDYGTTGPRDHGSADIVASVSASIPLAHPMGEGSRVREKESGERAGTRCNSQPSTLNPQLPTVVIEPRASWKLMDLRECLEYRDLLYFLVLRDVTVLYKQTILGIAWALLNPFFSMVVFT